MIKIDAIEKKNRKIKPILVSSKSNIITQNPITIITSEIRVIRGPTNPLVKLSKSADSFEVRVDELLSTKKE